MRRPRSLRIAADAAVVVAYGLLLPARGAHRAPPRLLQPACLQAAALARRRSHSARHHGRRYGDRGDGDAHAAGARHGSRVPRRAGRHRRRSNRRASCTTCWRSAALLSWCGHWPALERGSLDCTPQAADGVTYAKKIDKAEARIDFTQHARDVHNLIRGLSPFPGAWFEAGADGKRERIKVLRASRRRGQRRAGHGARRHS